MKIKLLHYTPIDPIIEATAMPYQSKGTNQLVKRVWDSGHKSIARHGMASFLITDVSQSTLRQISRHSHINLTVKSTRYCDVSDSKCSKPSTVSESVEYLKDYKKIMAIYDKWKVYEEEYGIKDVAKQFLPLCNNTDLVLSGNYQALYEFCQLRNCTRVEEQTRMLSWGVTDILRQNMPEIFKDLGCRGDELGYCPESHGSCGKYRQKK